MKKIGPPLPPHLLKKREDLKLKQAFQEEKEKFISSDSSGSQKVIKGCSRPEDLLKKQIGPTLPPSYSSNEYISSKTETTVKSKYNDLNAFQSHEKSEQVEEDKEEEDDDDDDEGDMIGPVPLHFHSEPSDYDELDRLKVEIVERAEKKQLQEKTKTSPIPEKLERGEWMTVPPSSRSLNELNSLKSRKFATKSRNTEFDPTWTQTPQDKLNSLDPGVREKKHSKKRSRSPTVYASQTARDRELSNMINEYNNQHRNASLMEVYHSNPEYSKRLRRHEEEALSRPFDREKDLTGRAPMTAAQRKEYLNRVTQFSDKFGHGKTQFL